MSNFTTVRISKASLARLKERAAADGLSATDWLHRAVETPAPAYPVPQALDDRTGVQVYTVNSPGPSGTVFVPSASRGPDPAQMTPGERVRWEARGR